MSTKIQIIPSPGGCFARVEFRAGGKKHRIDGDLAPTTGWALNHLRRVLEDAAAAVAAEDDAESAMERHVAAFKAKAGA